MDLIALIIEKERIVISYKEDYLNNQNIEKILIYKIDYLKDNSKIITNNINNFIDSNNLLINEMLINNFELLKISLKLLKGISTINTLSIKENEILNNNVCKSIMNIKHVKKLECYDINDEMLDKLENKGIEVHLKTEILNISNFVFDNKLNLYDDIFYREKILFKNKIDNKDLTGFNKFCEINEYLKQINIFCDFTLEDLKKIINILIDNNLTDVDINIYPELIGIDKINLIINELKKINKKYKSIKISTKYSNFYKTKNLLKQINFNAFKTTIGIIIAIVSSILIYMAYYSYETYKGVNDVKKENKKITETKNTKTIEEIVEEKNEEPQENKNEIQEEVKEEYIPPIVQDFSKLSEINSDTVGWLTVKNTHVDYPVVKASDNNYYLNKNFYKKTTTSGWIYMDYRNDIDELDRNTIIYGHSGLNDKTLMFASLLDVLNEDWYINKDNQIITFNSLNQNMNFRIFSIYTIDPSYNYIQTQFLNDNEYLNFIGDVTNKSIYDFGVVVDETDKILTLSTCYEKGVKRLVIHAKLMK